MGALIVVPVLLVLLILLALACESAWAHPGRLAQDGCHEVHEPYRYVDGRELAAGTRHCHRKLGEGMTLEGREVLEDVPAGQGTPAPPRRPDRALDPSSP